MSAEGRNPNYKWLNLEPQSADPTSPNEGDLFYSDGTPRAENLWVYKNGAWTELNVATTPPSLQTTEFTSSGNFVVPSGITEVFIEACGGGGGGGGGARGTAGAGGGYGASGGAGATPTLMVVKVTASDTLTVTLGAGGAAGAGGATNATAGTNGSDGGNTTIIGIGVDLIFPGAANGIAGGARGTGPGASVQDYGIVIGGMLSAGASGAGASTFNGTGNSAGKTVWANTAAVGGTAGTVLANSGSAGGGGGSGFGVGGAGGNGSVGAGVGGVGVAATNYGAGGGGGGAGGASASSNVGGAGGAGFTGYAKISWVGT